MKYQLAKLFLGLRRCFWPRNNGLRIAIFHDISEDMEESFEKFLIEVSKRWGFVSPLEVEYYLKGKAKGSPVLITFDDGFKGNFKVACEILSKYNIKALFFVCPSLIEMDIESQHKYISSNVFQNKKKADNLSVMNWEELRILQDNGHVIGSHTLNHLNLASLGDDHIEKEITGSKQAIYNNLGVEPKWFAFPFGEIKHINLNSLKVISSYYTYCRSGIRGVNNAGNSKLGLFAQHIELSAPLAYQMLALEGGLDFRYTKARQELQGFLPL